MSNSKLLPPFTFDVLCYLNRDQLERFSIVCRSVNNFIDRYFRSKPYRIFDRFEIRGETYALFHNFNVGWHPNRDDYSVQQFLAGQPCHGTSAYYSFAEMRPYLGPTIRIKKTVIYVAGDFTYNPEQIDEMESIAYLWSDHKINIQNNLRRIRAEDIQPILNSTTILRCRIWEMENTHFPFKEYEILYAMKILEVRYHGDDSFDLWHRYWHQFLEKPGVKPIVAFYHLHRENVNNLLDQLSKDFSSAVSPNTYTIIIEFVRNEPLNEFRKVNNTSGEILEFKKGFPEGYQKPYLVYHPYTLERSSI